MTSSRHTAFRYTTRQVAVHWLAAAAVITGLPKKQKSRIAYRAMLRPDEARSLVGAFAARAADKQPG